ncbi:MAG: enoyl-CoA hydratase [Acidimicrobiia bacterium]|nr:enoyl-CoA hydratase [Acidimicrobiia bacterium]
MSEDAVLYEVRDRTALITLNRPERLNAWNPDIHQGYFDSLDRAAADPDVRVIVVTGAGRGFCAGADMNVLQGIDGGGGNDDGREADTRAHTHAMTIPKPIIAAVNGACAGLGFVHALACDLRFAAEGAKFTVAFSRRGLIAEHGCSWTLPRLVGQAVALDLMLSGRVFLAEEAKELGVVNQVFPPDQLLDQTFAYAEDLATNVSPTSMAVMKHQIYHHPTMAVGDALAESNKFMRESLRRPDFKEGVSSFVEKRPPEFAPYTD